MTQMWLKFAVQNTLRNRRRSLFSALALAIGLALLLFMAGVVSGEMATSLDSSIALQSGHLQIRTKDYNEGRTSLAFEDLVENPTDLAVKISQLAPVLSVTPRLFATGIASIGDRSIGLRIMGIDPAADANAPLRKELTAADCHG